MSDDELGPVWKALSDPSRRRILDLLKEGPRTTRELCAAFDVSRFAVMKHLSVLHQAGLILVRRRGRERWNHLNAVPLRQIYERWLKPYEAQWATSLVKLRRYVEGTKGKTAVTAVGPTLETFFIEQEITIEAPPERVFEALTREMSSWWREPYVLSEAAEYVMIEPEVGGRLYEPWGDNEGILLGVVTRLKRPVQLEITGPIGMPGAVHAVVTLELEPQEKATLLRLSHRALGEAIEPYASRYDEGWQALLGQRLKDLVEGK